MLARLRWAARTVHAEAGSMDTKRHEADVCVVGGGMAGLCAALAGVRFVLDGTWGADESKVFAFWVD
jgi:hypothetical protein